MPEMKDLIAIFRAETEEHLTQLDSGLVELERHPENVELARSLNREVHTLKGAARVFGFNKIQDIAHRIEDLFERVAGKKALFTSAMAERIFRGLDTIRALLETIDEEQESNIDISDQCRELEEFASSGEEVQAGETRQRRPKRGIRSGETRSQAESVTKNEVEKHGAAASRPETAPTPPSPAPPPAVEYIRVPMGRVDKLLYLVGEMVIYKMRSSSTITQAKRLSKLGRELQRSLSGLSETLKKELLPADGEPARWLGQCEALAQKLRERTLKLYDQVTTEAFHLDPVIDELQARMKEIKMLPLSTIFNGFPRMVRDIASQQGKAVRLLISGEETELDKRVMEGIKTSLIHILRNCIDHGIERPEVRAAQGKQRQGTIKISAFHEADNVMIIIEDDGSGIDIDQVALTALEKGLIAHASLERMSEKDILNLVFLNGYSTSPTVTDVSGRGMGLNIVQRDIARLKGRVLLDTQRDQGTTFTLVLPLTVAVIQVLLVRVQGMLFALPMHSITESLKVRTGDVSTLEGRMAISLRDQIVPLVRLEELLKLPPAKEAEGKAKEETFVVIASSVDRRVGLIVEEVVGDEEVFIKGLGKHLGKVANVSGAIIMPTGEVVVVLDVTDLIAHSAVSLLPVTEKQSPTREKQKERKILVVEDAFSTRELEKSILENHGYRVDTAVDGLDALDRMAAARYDLVVSDIEMPRMDGFELCRTLKKREGTKDIPFVMVTAMEKDEDKRRGMEVGASAYIVKSAFEQANLLETIERLVG